MDKLNFRCVAVYFFATAIFFGSLAFAGICDRPNLPTNYKEDCELRGQFKEVMQSGCFRSAEEMESTKIYSGLRLMSRYEYDRYNCTFEDSIEVCDEETCKKMPCIPATVPDMLIPRHSEAGENSVWGAWNNGNDLANKKIQALTDSWNLSLRDISELHKATITEKILGSNNSKKSKIFDQIKMAIFSSRTKIKNSVKYLSYQIQRLTQIAKQMNDWDQDMASSIYPKMEITALKPGQIRSGKFPTHAIGLTQDEFNSLKTDTLVNSGVLTLMERPKGILARFTHNVKQIWELRPSYPYAVLYTKSDQVEKKLRDLLLRVNQTMQAFAKCNRDPNAACPEVSPIEFASQVQREYVSIHPFNDGCGRTSRMLQDMIMRSLDFPVIPGGDLGSDVSTTSEQYYRDSQKALRTITSSLAECCEEAPSEAVRRNCRVFHDGKEIDFLPRKCKPRKPGELKIKKPIGDLEHSMQKIRNVLPSGASDDYSIQFIPTQNEIEKSKKSLRPTGRQIK